MHFKFHLHSIHQILYATWTELRGFFSQKNLTPTSLRTSRIFCFYSNVGTNQIFTFLANDVDVIWLMYSKPKSSTLSIYDIRYLSSFLRPKGGRCIL